LNAFGAELANAMNPAIPQQNPANNSARIQVAGMIHELKQLTTINVMPRTSSLSIYYR
jgi:hypothetical protein